MSFRELSDAGFAIVAALAIVLIFVIFTFGTFTLLDFLTGWGVVCGA
jgi:preprotein translocase subunit SecE